MPSTSEVLSPLLTFPWAVFGDLHGLAVSDQQVAGKGLGNPDLFPDLFGMWRVILMLFDGNKRSIVKGAFSECCSGSPGLQLKKQIDETAEKRESWVGIPILCVLPLVTMGKHLAQKGVLGHPCGQRPESGS